jgi:hypothetical protein
VLSDAGKDGYDEHVAGQPVNSSQRRREYACFMRRCSH